MDGGNMAGKCACTRWVPLIGKKEIIRRENWISLENNRMRILMKFGAYV